MGIDLISLNDPSNNLVVDLDNISDFSKSDYGVIANLAKAEVLAPIYGTIEQPKILTIGDSITSGEYPIEPTPGAYRLQLKNNFVADDLSVDFIGSQANNIANLDDLEHEGHPGWTIDELTDLVNQGLLSNYQPDVVLIMAGTNDILKSDDDSTVINDLNQLVDLLQDKLPNKQILVSNLVPIDPAFKGELKASIVQEVNTQLPELAEQQGSFVTYVDGGGLLNLDDLVADGIHPNAAGYYKIGNSWYDSLIERENLLGVDHIKGTERNDRLTGNEQANILFGNGGSDILSGGQGADSFIYGYLDSKTDTITDFSLEDRFIFSTSDLNSSLVSDTSLKEIESDTEVLISDINPESAGFGATFLYQTDTGLLSFDPDGSGLTAASGIALLSGMPPINSEQLIITA